MGSGPLRREVAICIGFRFLVPGFSRDCARKLRRAVDCVADPCGYGGISGGAGELSMDSPELCRAMTPLHPRLPDSIHVAVLHEENRIIGRSGRQHVAANPHVDAVVQSEVRIPYSSMTREFIPGRIQEDTPDNFTGLST